MVLAPPQTEAELKADAAERAEPSLRRRLAGASAIYLGANLANVGVSFFLLPLYTHLLAPGDYGILAVVVGVSGFLNILFTLSLHAAAQRLYFDYRDEPEELEKFWGTLLTTVLLVGVGATALLMLAGEPLLQPILKDIAFWPFMGLGILAVTFQPFLSTFLAMLQTTERARLYGAISVLYTLTKALLAVGLVAGLGLGVIGALWAPVGAAGVLFAASLYLLRGNVRYGLRLRHLRTALRYSLPLVPHLVAAQARLILDRLFLLHLAGRSAAGIYNVGFQFGVVINVVVWSVNRAYMPVFMSAMKARDEAQLAEIRTMAMRMVFGYCLASAGISLFAPETITLITAEPYYEAWLVVPLLCFSFAAGGIYSLLCNVLFYLQQTTKYVAVGTIGSLGCSAFLNYLLIPSWGILGAAFASLLAQIVFVILIGLIAHRFSLIRWQYERFAALYLVSLAGSLLPYLMSPFLSWSGVALKTLWICGMFFLLSAIAFHDPFYVWRRLRGPRPGRVLP